MRAQPMRAAPSPAGRLSGPIQSAAGTPAAAALHLCQPLAAVLLAAYGHVKAMAEKVKEGVDSVEGAEATIFQVGCCGGGGTAAAA